MGTTAQCCQPVIEEGFGSLSPVDLQSSSVMISTFGSNYESDDSISEFERKLKVLLPDLHGGSEFAIREQSRSTRKSERKKKPSSHFNEEANFIIEPLRSSKKKVM